MATTLRIVLLSLTIACLMVEPALSVPLKVGPVDKDLKAAKDRFSDVLQLLSDKKSLAMAIDFLSSKVSQQGLNTWKYPPQIESDKDEEKKLSPSEKAIRKHFEVSEPGTGPVLNHPLGKGAADAVLKLLHQLLSEAD